MNDRGPVLAYLQRLSGCSRAQITRLVSRWDAGKPLVKFALALWLLALLPGPAAAGPTCHGRFMNPITDICWSCLFPLTIGSASILSDGQPDIGNPSSPVCYCSNPPRVGVSIGFWEPVRMVDVTRTPFCMVGLGGIALDPGLDVPRGAHVGHDSQTRNSFYHPHWYANPILTWLEVLLDFPCLEKGSLDLAHLTEVDPLWADDELTAILNPEAELFANAPAKVIPQGPIGVDTTEIAPRGPFGPTGRGRGFSPEAIARVGLREPAAPAVWRWRTPSAYGSRG